MRMKRAVCRYIIERCKSHIFRTRHSQLFKCLEHTLCHDSIADKDSCWLHSLRHQFMSHSAPRLETEIPFCYQPFVVRKARIFERESVSFKSFVTRLQVQGSGHDCDPSMP